MNYLSEDVVIKLLRFKLQGIPCTYVSQTCVQEGGWSGVGSRVTVCKALHFGTARV